MGLIQRARGQIRGSGWVRGQMRKATDQTFGVPKSSKKKFGFKPYDPSKRPPTGTYDPSIDAASEAAQRGYGYAQEDTGTNMARAGEDLGIRKAALNRARSRVTQDYGISTQGVKRNYAKLALSQTDAARAAGVDTGGWAGQAKAARDGNQKIEQDALDLSLARANQDFDTQGQEADLDYTRYTADQNTGLTRAGVENTAYQGSAQQSRIFQATQTGWDAPKKPSGKKNIGGIRVSLKERKDSKGDTYRIGRTKKGSLVNIYSSGKIKRR